MIFMHLALASILFAAAGASHAETILDNAIEFSIDAPSDAKIEKGSTGDGGYVSLNFRDNASQEVVIMQAMRITKSGKFREPSPEVFNKFVAGMSGQMKVAPAKPIQTLTYLGQTLYVATHLNVGASPGPRQGWTTIGFFEEKGSWHKVIFLQFISAANMALSDNALQKKLAGLKYVPALDH